MIRFLVFSLLLFSTLAADQIRIDWRNGTTGNFSPVNLTAVQNFVLTFDASGNPVIAAQSGGTGNVATDAIWDATGDLAVGSGANTSARLAMGTALQVLRVNAGATALEWAASSSGAPTDATYITQTANGTLSAEQALGALATGILKNTTTTGVLSIAAAGTDYVVPGGALGTPSSGTVTNLTGTASININGTVGATTPAAGTFTTATATTLAGAGGGITLDASGFNGNLATTDNTLQEVAQKLDDLTASGTPGGSDTFMQYNDGGVFGGEAGFTYNKTTNVLTVPNLTSAGTVDLSAATVTLGTITTLPVTNIELGHATANTLTAASGDLSIEGVVVAKRTGGNTFTGTQVFPSGQALIAPALGTIASGVGTALTALNGENIQDDTIDDDSIDFGTGTDQVSAVDIPIADTGAIFTATDTEAALLELAKVPTKQTATSYTVGTTDPRELYGGVIYVTGAATITIPAVAAGASFTVITVGAVAVSVDPNAADLIMLNGVAASDGDKITNTSTSGDIAVFTYYDATGWYAATNSGWTDTN